MTVLYHKKKDSAFNISNVVFLEIQNVWIRLVFLDLITYFLQVPKARKAAGATNVAYIDNATR